MTWYNNTSSILNGDGAQPSKTEVAHHDTWDYFMGIEQKVDTDITKINTDTIVCEENY